MPNILRNPAYQNLDIDLDPPRHVEILVPDPDDELGAVERAAKRRRIEGHARQYLKDMPLYIQSAELRGPFEQGWRNPWRKKKATKALERKGQDHMWTKKGDLEIADTGASPVGPNPFRTDLRSPNMQRSESSTTVDSGAYTKDWLKTRFDGSKSRYFDGKTPISSLEQQAKLLVNSDDTPSRRTKQARAQDKSKSDKTGLPARVAPDVAANMLPPQTPSRRPQSRNKAPNSGSATSIRLHWPILDNKNSDKVHQIDTKMGQQSPTKIHEPPDPTRRPTKVLANNVQAANAHIGHSSQDRPASREKSSPPKRHSGFTPINRVELHIDSAGHVPERVPETSRADPPARPETHLEAVTLRVSPRGRGREAAKRLPQPLSELDRRSIAHLPNADPTAYRNSTSTQGFAYRRATDSPPNVKVPTENHTAPVSSQTVPHRKTRRRVSFTSTPAGQIKAPKNAKPAVATTVPERGGVAPNSVFEKDSTSAGPKKTNSKAQDTGAVVAAVKDSSNLLRRAVSNASVSIERQSMSNEAQVETISLSALGPEAQDPYAYSTTNEDFSTQAAILEAQRAFQDDISPIRPSLPSIPSAEDDNDAQHDVQEVTMKLSPIAPFRAFQTSPGEEAPVSTQELFDAAKGLAFSTLKKPQSRQKSQQRTSFAENVPVDDADDTTVILAGANALSQMPVPEPLLKDAMPSNREPAATDIDSRVDMAERPSDLPAHSSPRTRSSARKPFSAIRSSLTNGTTLVLPSSALPPPAPPPSSAMPAASMNQSGMLLGSIAPPGASKPSTVVPIFSQNAQRMDETTMSLGFGIDGDADFDLDGAVDDCSAFLDGWDVESDLKKSREGEASTAHSANSLRRSTRSSQRKVSA